MVQQTLYLLCYVLIGSTKIILKITHYIVCKYIFLKLKKSNIFILVWTNDRWKLKIIAFSSISEFQMRLPAGNNNLIVHIQDPFYCITEYNISSSIHVRLDLKSSNNNPFIEILSTGNQNTVGQTVISLSEQLNQINDETIDKAVSG
jgi:hypothetical protein